MKEPKRFVCIECNHKFNKPKLQRAVLSDFTTLKAYCCPKCLKVKTGKDNPEWVDWMNQKRDDHIKQALESGSGTILGRSLPTGSDN